MPGAELRDVDALVTRAPGVGLVALAADCVPVVLVEPDRGHRRVVHSGWRGVALDVVGAALDQVDGLGGSVRRVRAWSDRRSAGPATRCPPSGSSEVARRRARRRSRPRRDGQPSLDLRAGLAPGWARRGVAERDAGRRLHGRGSAACTRYRRDGVTGRHGRRGAAGADREVA